jgi:hypothetical protein
MSMTWDTDIRRAVWDALYADDPQKLSEYLTSNEVIRGARTGMWNPNKKGGKKDTHLLDVMLLQKTGVNYNKGGALKCYAWLNDAFPDAYTTEEKTYVTRRYHAGLAS